jgi:hypothetical protein
LFVPSLLDVCAAQQPLPHLLRLSPARCHPERGVWRRRRCLRHVLHEFCKHVARFVNFSDIHFCA